MAIPAGDSAFVNVNSDKVLEVKGGSSEEGARVGQGDDEGKAHQRWKLAGVPGHPGVYTIQNVGSGKVLDVETEDQGSYIVQRTLRENEQRQQWELVSTREGAYQIRNYKTKGVVDVSGGRVDNDAPLRQYRWGTHTDGRQEWKLTTRAVDHRPEIATGPLWAWGNNSKGQLGNGQTTRSATPVEVQGLTSVRQLAVGDEYSMALLADGTVRTWGYHEHGELGDGTSASAHRCLATGGPFLSGVQAIAPGTWHALALLENQEVRAWGFNNQGQLGDNTETTRIMPVPVLGLQGVTAIAAGTYHSVALLEDKTVWTWGYNAQGQLGNDSTTKSSKPVRVVNHYNERLEGVKKISAGHQSNLALLENGSVWAWGDGGWGQLGNNRYVNQSYAVPVLDSEGKRLEGVKDISAGPYHALALLHDNGKLLAWGHNEEGQLGNATVTGNKSSVPVAVIDDGERLTGVTAICAAGYVDHEYSIALKDGVVLAWGKNNHQQLGNEKGGGADPKPVVDRNGERLTGVTMIAVDRGSAHYLVACG